jgi:AraC family cel operon transcriptional repressor
MKKILWNEIKFENSPFHYAKPHYKPQERYPLHYHGFAELFMVEAGSGFQKLNNQSLTLSPGNLFFIRPKDKHSIIAGDKGLILMNCAFPLDRAVEQEKKYFSTTKGYFSCTDDMPCIYKLEGELFTRAKKIFNYLGERDQSDLLLDLLLLNMYELLSHNFIESIGDNMPSWLLKACKEIKKQEYLEKGISQFFELAGKSPEHVSREMKRYTGKTPGSYVTELRLERACKYLCTTDKSILELAFLCGYENLSWFHRSFRKQYGITPGEYRKKSFYR